MTRANLNSSSARFTPLKRVSKLLPSVLIPMALIGCAAGPIVLNTAIAQQQPQSFGDDRAQIMYEIMVSEMAGRRGYLDIATEGYLRASKRTDDPRVAERATQLAVWGQEWDKAREAVERWLELEPDSGQAREILAQIVMESGPTDTAAIDQFVEIVEDAEDRELVLNEMFILLLREEDRTSVLATLRGLQENFPDEPQAHLNVGRYLLQQNDQEEALVAIDQSLAIDPEKGEALLMKAQILSAQGNPTEGLNAIKAVLDKDSDRDTVSLRLGYARLLSDSGRYTEASEQFEYLFENEGDNSDVLLSIGLLALDAKRVDEAKRYLDALKVTGDHRDQAYYYLGRISDQQQLVEEAIKNYEEVGQSDLYLSAQLRSAELYAVSGKLDVGIERVRSLASVLPDPALQPMLITTESRMLQDAGRGEDAVTVLSDGLEKFPLNAELLYARALASESTGDTDSLISDLDTLIDAEPENASALNALGYFLADENIRLDDAQTYLEKAISLRPDDAAILDSLGWLRYRQGNYEAAKKLLERAYELLADGEIAAHLGEVLWVIGDKTAAQSIWDAALDESPDHEKVKDTIDRLTKK